MSGRRSVWVQRDLATDRSVLKREANRRRIRKNAQKKARRLVAALDAYEAGRLSSEEFRRTTGMGYVEGLDHIYKRKLSHIRVLLALRCSVLSKEDYEAILNGREVPK